MLTNEKGEPIKADDPRVPRPSEIEAKKAAADTLLQVVRSIPGARRDVAEVAARVDSLIDLFIPADGPVRAVFDLQVQAHREDNFRKIVEAYQTAKAEAERPKLVVPTLGGLGT